MTARDPDALLVDFVADRNVPVPAAVRNNVAKCAVDFFANATSSARLADSSSALLRGVAQLGATGAETTVIGHDQRCNYTYAAMLNGAFAHSLDFDDTSAFGSVHPGAVVFPAVFAIGELTDASWDAVLDAAAVGIEIACRVGAALGATAYDRGFHLTPVAGVFGAVAGIARLKHFQPAILSSAFALSGSQAAGSMQYLDNGAWNKRVHPGLAAHAALIACAFAEAGVLGASQPLAGRYGLLTGYSNAPCPKLLTDRLGFWWAAGDVAIKPYPSCRLTHGAIEAAFGLRSSIGRSPTSSDLLSLKISPKAFQITGGQTPNKLKPANSVDAQFSIYFQCAAAWLHGAVTQESYEMIGHPDVLALMASCDVVPDESIPDLGAELSLLDATVRRVRVDCPSGEPENPIGWEAVEAKFGGLSGALIGEARVADVVGFVRSPPPAARLRDLLALVSGPFHFDNQN